MNLEEQHTQACLQLLGLNANLLNVYDGAVPRPFPPPPYVVVYTRTPFTKDGVGVALDAVQDAITTTVTCHCVGETAVAARVIQMQVRSSLLNVRPLIDGRVCGPIKMTAAENPNYDDTTGHTVFDAMAEFEFLSTG